MVLVLDGALQSTCPKDTQSLYTSHPLYRETATALLALPKTVVGPAGLLYVLQREFAATVVDDKDVSVLGSDDATTCIIVVVRHPGTGAVALGHFDGSDTRDAIFAMTKKVQKLASCFDGRLEVGLVGGYTDAHRMSEDLFFNIMNTFQQLPIEIAVTLACVGQMNTEIKEGVPWPILYGVGVVVKTGAIFPATFPEKGPDECLRSARHLSGNRRILDVYDSGAGSLTFGPFDYAPPWDAEFLAQQDDRYILDNMSTSPQVEAPHFAAQIRATLRYMLDNPARVVFKDKRARRYRRDGRSGSWVPVS